MSNAGTTAVAPLPGRIHDYRASDTRRVQAGKKNRRRAKTVIIGVWRENMPRVTLSLLGDKGHHDYLAGT